MEQNTLISFIENQRIFSDDEKKEWINCIRKEGMSYELLWDLELALLDGIEQFFSRNHLRKSIYSEEMKQLKTQRDTALHALESLQKEVSTIAKSTTLACDMIAAKALKNIIQKKEKAS